MFIIYGSAIMALGFLIVFKSDWIYNNVGPIGTFERFLRLNGGSRLGYQILGILIIVLGFIITVNMFDIFMTWLVSPLTKYNR